MSRLAQIPLVVMLSLLGLPAWPQENAAGPQEIINPLTRLGPASMENFVTRPLFAPSRTAPPKPGSESSGTASLSAPTITAPKIQVVGIVQTPKERIVQVINLEDDSRYSVRQGDFIGGWSVAAVERDSLKMRLDDREEIYTILPAQSLAEPVGLEPEGGQPRTGNTGSPPSPDDVRGFFGESAKLPN